jgi:UTP-glucose-1-phosphate uridylyltransferase
MIDVFEKVGGPVLAVERVSMDQVSNYGIVDVDSSVDLGKGVHLVRFGREAAARRGAVESHHRRYLLTPDIFPPSANRERQDGEPADQTAAGFSAAKNLRL